MKFIAKITSTMYKTMIILLLTTFLPFLSGTAQDFTKTFDGKYDVDKGANLVIKNKFGDIKCVNWDESTVSIVVTVKVDAPSQEKANKVFDKITVELSGNRTKVEGTTEVENINNGEFSINYEIRMPRWINIDLYNQFGDILVDEIDGTTRIKLEYGNMEAIAFNGLQTDLTIKFSDGNAGYIKDGNLNIEYSEWESRGAEKLRVYSSFTELKIGKIAMLNLDSQYDEVTVESAGEVVATSKFSELEFGKINGDFDFDIEYGELDVDYISPAFKLGKVRNTFAGSHLSFDAKAALNVNAEMEFGELTYPKAVSMNHETIGFTTNIYKGKLGSITGSTSQLTITSKNADTSISFIQ